MQKLYKAVYSVCRVFFAISLIGIFLMMCLIVADVLMRAIFNNAIMGSYELVQILMVILVFFAFGFTQLGDGHVKVTLLTERFPKSVQRYLSAIMLLLVTAAMLLVSWATFEQGLKTITTTSALYIPLKPFYFCAALGALIYSLCAFLNAIEYFVKGNMTHDTDNGIIID
jgi:TRAP-type C4-dicarboxylate transport system permease small subunit